jgi:hypothetical protein
VHGDSCICVNAPAAPISRHVGGDCRQTRADSLDIAFEARGMLDNLAQTFRFAGQRDEKRRKQGKPARESCPEG